MDAEALLYAYRKKALALGLAARQLPNLLLVGAARGGALGLGSRLLAGGALQFLALCCVGNALGICQCLLSVL